MVQELSKFIPIMLLKLREQGKKRRFWLDSGNSRHVCETRPFEIGKERIELKRG